MPQTVPWKNEELPLNEVLGLTNTNAFVVLHNGEVVDEWYAEASPRDPVVVLVGCQVHRVTAGRPGHRRRQAVRG